MSSVPPIVLSAFQGEQPRFIPRLMPETSAQSAFDTRLDDGGLTPMRESSFIDNVSSTYKSIYYYQNDWIGWDVVTYAVPGPVATDRLYTMDGVKPKLRVGSTVYDLAVLPPANTPNPGATPLVATLGGTGAGDIQTRLYVYTYVTFFDEESEPSPASNSVDWKPGNNVTLSGILAPPAGRNIDRQRIYRSQTGSIGTNYYLIAERAASAANFVDTIPVDALQEPLPSVAYNAPPDDLTGLIALANGMMAAFRGKQLYFSEPYKPHAWPEKYVLTVEHPIVALGAMGISIIVTTNAHPFLVTGTTPDRMVSQKLESNYPCIAPRSLVDLGFIIAWASNDGIVAARADGSIGMATTNIFSPEDWQKLNPAEVVGYQTGIIGGQIRDRYVGFYDTLREDGSRERAAIFIDMAVPTFLVRSNVYADAVMYDMTRSALYYKPAGVGQVRQLDAPNAIRKTLYWKSKEFVLPYPENYGAFLIDTIQTEEDPVNYDEALATAVAFNTALIAARYPPPATGTGLPVSIGGALNGGAVNLVELDGDILQPMPHGSGSVLQVGIYADKKRVASITRSNHSVRLPSGFKARTWEIDVSSNRQIHRMAMAKTMDDLKQATP